MEIIRKKIPPEIVMDEKILVTVDYYEQKPKLYCQLAKQSRKRIKQGDIHSLVTGL